MGPDAAGAQGATPPVIHLVGVEKRYGDVTPLVALDGVDLDVARGEWLAVVGASGSGKTTLLNIVGCLDRPSAGTYHLDGRDVVALDDPTRAAVRGHALGFVFQSFHLLGHRSALENVMLAEAYGRRPREGRRERARAALAAVGLDARRDALPPRMSGGERQRVAIARAVVTTPAVLLCDEPTGNLDSVTAGTILDLLAGLHDTGLTIVMITHDAGVADRAQRRVRIADGRIAGAA